MTPGCVKHGVVVHEFVHALGFYQQQSSSDRDKFVIHWDNIIEGREHNFRKNDNDTVTNYKVGYNYSSLMHYGPRAFAKDKLLVTNSPKAENITIGQRLGLSKKDTAKLQIMHEEECKTRESEEKKLFL